MEHHLPTAPCGTLPHRTALEAPWPGLWGSACIRAAATSPERATPSHAGITPAGLPPCSLDCRTPGQPPGCQQAQQRPRLHTRGSRVSPLTHRRAAHRAYAEAPAVEDVHGLQGEGSMLVSPGGLAGERGPWGMREPHSLWPEAFLDHRRPGGTERPGPGSNPAGCHHCDAHSHPCSQPRGRGLPPAGSRARRAGRSPPHFTALRALLEEPEFCVVSRHPCLACGAHLPPRILPAPTAWPSSDPGWGER